jgi:FkbM family methyltransferase
MSALDWAKDTASHGDPAKAWRELKNGAVSRLVAVEAKLPPKRGVVHSPFEPRAKFRVTSPVDAKRAHNLNNEPEVAKWLLENTKQGDVVWDVGAHHGHFSVVLALANRQVVSFEPNVDNYQRLSENLFLNGLLGTVTTVPLALGEETGESDMEGDHDGGLRLTGEGDDVAVIRGDQAEQPGPDAVKLDVEGHELEALIGLGSLLEEVDAVAVECHGDAYGIESVLRSAGLEPGELDTARSQTHVVAK